MILKTSLISMVICISLQSKAEDESRQLRNQLQSMTEQLNQSETVQRDFVRLSQSLQVGRLTTLLLLQEQFTVLTCVLHLT